MLYAMASEVEEELDRAQKDQDRVQDELEFTCEGMVTASKQFTSCWALHSAACANVNNTSAKLRGAFRGSQQSPSDPMKQSVLKRRRRAKGPAELKTQSLRKRMRKTRSHRERRRRITNEHTRSGAAVNNSLGFMVRCVKETAAATHLAHVWPYPIVQAVRIRHLK